MTYKRVHSHHTIDQQRDRIRSPTTIGGIVTNQIGRNSNGFHSKHPRQSPRRIRISKLFRSTPKSDPPLRVSRPTSPICHRTYDCTEYPILPCHSYPAPRPISRPLSPPIYRSITSERLLQPQGSFQNQGMKEKRMRIVDRINVDCVEDQFYLSYNACKELFPVTACIGATALCCFIL